MVWERALSLRNPWIQQMEQYKTPEALDRNFVKKYIEQVAVAFLGDRQAEISLTMKTQEWKQMLERIEWEGTDDGTKVWYRPSSKMFMCMRVGESLYSSNMSRVYRMP